MNYDKWPDYIQRRIALTKTALDPNGLAPIKASGSSAAEIGASQAIEWVYAVLTTMDAKASALMRLNGVVIAAAAFLLGLFKRQGGTILSTDPWHAIFIVVCAFLSGLSIALCLGVVRVSWPFLGKVILNGSEPASVADELTELDATCSRRKKLYCFAWWISLLAAVVFLVEFAVQSWYVIVIATQG